MATVGYGVMAPATACGHVISAIEIVCGTAFTAIVTGLLFVLLGERTEEGGYFKRIHDLPLVQSHLPLFVMPWTLMHAIDEASPLTASRRQRCGGRTSGCS